ncbi:3,4-dihydroxy-2-butanone-4-phosphate synthase [Candidatus Woesearchaeota archaeon]|nr:3,4-dihydroxy-2-butanone-4-phosphate synthase [Candidatus Woesearchaeota archaeon]
MGFSAISKAAMDLQRGRFIVVVDDENRENEGDLVLAAEKAVPSKINFMIKKARGLICVPMLKQRLDELDIPLMVRDKENTEITRCRFTVSVDLKNDRTGISAHDRSDTIKALINKETKPGDLSRPGHVFPLQYSDGGVLKRPGHTEAAIDICKIAGIYPAAVICEILNEKGDAAKLEELKSFAEKHNLRIISIEELARYIRQGAPK